MSSMDIPHVKALVFDFSRVLLFAKDPNYSGSLNSLHQALLENDADYTFLDYFYLNQDLLDYLKKLPDLRLIIFTSGIIQDAPVIQSAIRSVFESIFSAANMGARKAEADAYLQLCKQVNLRPSEILYIDDDRRNVDAARAAGLHTLLFTSNSQLFQVLEKLR